jgi:hypothetical protein
VSAFWLADSLAEALMALLTYFEALAWVALVRAAAF